MCSRKKNITLTVTLSFGLPSCAAPCPETVKQIVRLAPTRGAAERTEQRCEATTHRSRTRPDVPFHNDASDQSFSHVGEMIYPFLERQRVLNLKEE